MSINLLESRHPDFLASQSLVEEARSGAAVPIAGTAYLLVRLPRHLELSLTQLLFEIGVETRLRPILLDAERNDAIQEQPFRLSYYYRRGARAAVSAETLLGRGGELARQTARRLVSARLVQLIVSEAAESSILTLAEEVAAELLSPALAGKMVREIPAAVLAGGAIEFPPPLDAPSPRGRWGRLARYLGSLTRQP